MIIEKRLKDGTIEKVQIERANQNIRERPDGKNRHAEIAEKHKNFDSLRLLNSKDLEWLAWNWRAYKNDMKFKSRKQMVYSHFNNDIPFLPSPNEILKGIIHAQVNQFSTGDHENL